MSSNEEISRLELKRKLEKSQKDTKRLENEYNRKYGKENRYALGGFIIGFIVGTLTTFLAIYLKLTNPH